MIEKNKIMIVCAIFLFLSWANSEFTAYKSHRLKTLYGEDYYRKVYFFEGVDCNIKMFVFDTNRI